MPNAQIVMSEPAVIEWTLNRLAPHFHIEQEVSGKHPSGRRMRIDALLIPKKPEDWFDRLPCLGIEFKRIRGDTNAAFVARHLSQCIDYAQTSWKGFGEIPVFYHPTEVGRQESYILSRLLWEQRVGCIRTDIQHRSSWSDRPGNPDYDPGAAYRDYGPYGLTFFSGVNAIWSENGGVRHYARSSRIRRPRGSG
jgi:hypothetical protein